MKVLRFFMIAAVLVLAMAAHAQTFLRKSDPQPVTFKEMQRRFDEWTKTVDLKKEKNWKYFKRWEMDMQMHTDAQGNPGDPAIYIDAITQAVKEKQESPSQQFSTSAWSPTGPNALPNNLTGYMENGIGRINCIAFHPTDPATYFVGVAQGGVWKTTNNGQTWIPLTDNLPITRISDIAIDPVNPNTMYISVCDFEYIGFGLYLNGRKRNTHYGLGVYKTTDGGLTWNPTALSFQLTQGDASLIRKVIVNPTNTSKLVACGVSGMYTSNDGGGTWTHRLDSLFWDLVKDPVNSNTLYAATGWVATANDGYAAIYKSTDFGVTWNMLNTGIPQRDSVQRIKLAIAPSDPNYIYALAVDVNSGMYDLYKTINAGTTWQRMHVGLNILESSDGTNPGGQGNYDMALLVNSVNKDVIYTGGVNIWGSVDGGQTFDPASHWTLSYGPTLHGDIHFIEQQSLTGNIFVCNDGGLYRAANIITQTWTDADGGSPWPTQWTKLNSGMQVTSFYRLCSSKNGTGRLIAGAQDNASFYYDGSAWATVIGGDGMDNFLDPTDDNLVIGSSQYGNFDQSIDGGASFNYINPNVNNETGEWTTPIIGDYNQPGVLYSGYYNVVTSVDNGNTWASISNFPAPGFANNEISALAVARTNSDVIYAAKRVRYEYSVPGVFYVTTNGGSSWTDRTAGLPDSLYYTSVEAGWNNASTAYVTMAGFSTGNKVFKTVNSGATWQNISYNLPNLPVNCIKQIPHTGKVMVATDIGIYVLDSNSTTWVNKSVGLPNVITTDIEFNETLNKIYISTFGRGIWETDLDVFTSVPLAAANKIDAELYPSVNNGSFTIAIPQTEASRNSSFDLDVVDITGRLVYSSALSGQNNYQIHLDIPSGKYFARLKSKNISGVKSFIIE